MAVENRLLAALSREIYEKLAPNLKLISLHQGEVLHIPGETIQTLYFPIDSLISITITMSDGSTVEIGLVGNREVLGINALMCAESSAPSLLCQIRVCG
ncbi:cyclic nucleotide-binding domain-containing protein [Chlorogloeopsis sp. ULAP01]|uniref:cyclic nucleotide-binding domain-containing protein n=1 Tax=Chlorogloeopsis sp. ULAP01 TaxID=3056483 RepID=UPI0025AA5593|nr:cyclic nucleotide-binding domain-containing protein [Chlorogloeopsis sp. ULAP01]MDM9380668.1 cyclic nucleotide-binding domain-containing protein [Chlorogloeopsis sp. ULAP01]